MSVAPRAEKIMLIGAVGTRALGARAPVIVLHWELHRRISAMSRLRINAMFLVLSRKLSMQLMKRSSKWRERSTGWTPSSRKAIERTGCTKEKSRTY